ncbi:FAD-dependent monooxygenase [Undibacterium sp. Dicai25W]|uniref:FAD-dependent monooxygenase n=1 Tax=Undibacterium sp. Dicai25W TaxID=3413034 RepID=UPI003BEFC6A7
MKNGNTVLIVGAGPVGLVLAAQLTIYGIKVRIIEKRQEKMQGSKALGVNAASLKAFQQMGVADKFISAGIKIKHIYSYWSKKKLMHIDCDRLSHSPYRYSIALPQPQSEQILEDHLSSLGIQVEKGTELKHLVQNNGGVEATLHQAPGKIETATFEFAIGCDGSRSKVRELLGVAFEGKNYNAFMRLFDAEIVWKNKQREDAHYFIQEEGFLIAIPIPGGLTRIVISENHMPIDLINQKLKKDDYQQILNKYADEEVMVREITWESSAPLYNRLASRYRVKRIFLAGDSAHLFSPIGGLGMNTGIQDARNLAWKLAGVIQGDYSESMLDTYEIERRRKAEQLIASTDDTTEIISCGNPGKLSNIQYWLPTMSNRGHFRTTLPHAFSGLSQVYDSNSIIRKSSITSAVGGHVPFANLIDGNHQHVTTYQLSDSHLLIAIIFDNDGRHFDCTRHLMEAYRITFFAVSEKGLKNIPSAQHNLLDRFATLQKSLAAKEGDVVLIRPDGYIAYHAESKDLHALNEMLAEILRGVTQTEKVVCAPDYA